MSKLIDMTGQRFGKLTVIERDFSRLTGNASWKCVCDCGNISYVVGTCLRTGHTKSCGCLKGKHEKHGNAVKREETPEYMAWASMKARCLNPKNPAFENYGGRGITVCDRWKNSFNNFLDDMGKRPTNKHSLERVNNDKGYSPSNCVWETYTTQVRNQRIQKNNKTGATGVHWCKTRKKWLVRISIHRKQKHLGYFDNYETAKTTRIKAEKEYWN